jgi:hypothetical protein
MCIEAVFFDLAFSLRKVRSMTRSGGAVVALWD